MADQTKTPTPVETSFGEGSTFTADFTGDKTKPVIGAGSDGQQESFEDGASQPPEITDADLEDLNEDGTTPDPDDDSHLDPDADANEEPGEEGDEADADAELPVGELGAFDPADEAVVAKFDEVYFKDGKLNPDVLMSEFDANGDKKTLNGATYEYLESLGIPKDFVKEIESNRLALREQANTEFYASVGGKETYDAAFAWGKENYTEAQRTAFNAAKDKGGVEFDDAVEALMARYGKAVPGGVKTAATEKKTPALTLKDRRAASPKKDVTNSAAGGGNKTEGYADAAAHRAALKEAGDDAQKQEAVRKRLRASSWVGR